MYWVLRLDYSQTDYDNVIIKAETREKALTKADSNARYVSVIAGPIKEILK